MVLACLLAPAVVRADRLDDDVRREMARRRIPGLALAVLRQGQPPLLRGYGLASVELDVPVTPDTVFDLASVTKVFTATAVMALVAEGKLSLDDRVGAHVDQAPPAWATVTVRHLLTHTSGIAPPNSFAALLKPREPWLGDYTTRQLFEAATRDAVPFAPGARHVYRDTNYFLLGMIIERVSGERYGEFLARRFFRPLGMASTATGDGWRVVRHRAAGYTLRDGALARIRRDAHVELGSHTGLLSTAADLAKFDAALDEGRVLPRSVLREMWTPVTLADGSRAPYGFGWGVGDRRGQRLVGHRGATGADYVKLPDHGVTVIALTNLGNLFADVNPDVDSWLGERLAGHWVPALLASTAARQPDPAPDRARRYLAALAAFARGDTPAGVTPQLAAVLGAAGAEARRTTERRLSARRSFTYITSDDVRGRDVLRLGVPVARLDHYALVTDGETRYYTFGVTETERLAEMRSYAE
jgi:CubicO group peptidase (beta-lactamase class C family)